MALPDDVIQFYALSDGALLHASEYGSYPGPDARRWNWKMRPASEITPVSEDGYFSKASPLLPRANQWLVLVDVQDGDVLAISTEPEHSGKIIDCFHEFLGEVGRNAIVALSFTEMLSELLKSRSAFWLDEHRKEYGFF